MNIPADADQIVDQSLQLAAADVAIDSVEACERAVRYRQDVGAMIARVRAFFAPIKASAYKTHRDICDKESDVLAPLLAKDADVTNAIRTFNAAAAEERRERERQESERLRLQRDADAAADAAQAERDGDHATAAAILEDAIAAPAPVVVLPDLSKQVDGLKFRRRWLWRLAPGGDALIPREYLAPDEKKIGGYVRSMKHSGRIPGVEIYYVDDPIR